MTENEIARQIVDSSLKIHRVLGPGLLESVYCVALTHELSLRGLAVERELAVPVIYEGMVMETGFRVDLMVEHLVIVEVKSVEALAPVHTRQVITYLKLSGKRLGLLINFNVPMIKHGIIRLANGLADP